jgi:hypothetical protein
MYVVDYEGLTPPRRARWRKWLIFNGLQFNAKKMRGAPHGTPRTHHYTTNNYTPASKWSRVVM